VDLIELPFNSIGFGAIGGALLTATRRGVNEARAGRGASRIIITVQSDTKTTVFVVLYLNLEQVDESMDK